VRDMSRERPDQPPPSVDHPAGPDGPRLPRLLIFDVNETLSDMAPMARRFEDVGAPAHLATSWFAGLLRDGFALTAVDASDSFAHIAAESLRVGLHGVSLNRAATEAVSHIMDGFAKLSVHADVPDGIRALSGLGIRLVTLSNGSASVAEALFDRTGIRQHFESLLTVEDAGRWKPAAEHGVTPRGVSPGLGTVPGRLARQGCGARGSLGDRPSPGCLGWPDPGDAGCRPSGASRAVGSGRHLHRSGPRAGRRPGEPRR
jgi:2-haloacid dehalogenase